MKAIDYIFNNLNRLNKPILTQLLAQENVELTDELWGYLQYTYWNTNKAFLKDFGIDVSGDSEDGNKKRLTLFEGEVTTSIATQDAQYPYMAYVSVPLYNPEYLIVTYEENSFILQQNNYYYEEESLGLKIGLPAGPGQSASIYTTDSRTFNLKMEIEIENPIYDGEITTTRTYYEMSGQAYTAPIEATQKIPDWLDSIKVFFDGQQLILPKSSEYVYSPTSSRVGMYTYYGTDDRLTSGHPKFNSDADTQEAEIYPCGIGIAPNLSLPNYLYTGDAATHTLKIEI